MYVYVPKYAPTQEKSFIYQQKHWYKYMTVLNYIGDSKILLIYENVTEWLKKDKKQG